jgi:ribose transport system substrate-binding protein
MNRMRIATVLCISLTALFLPGCGSGNGKGAKDNKPSAKNPTATGKEGSATKPRLAFISNNAHGFWTYAQRGCEAAAKELDIDLEFQRPSKGTAAQQKEIIENLMITGVQGVAISPNDPGNFGSFLKNDVFAKIPLVMADNDLPDVKARNCYIGTHNYRAGRAAGALVKKAIPKGGKIVIFVGRMDATNAVERRQGMLDYLAGKNQDDMTERTPPGATDLPVGDYILVDTRTDDSSQVACQKKAEEVLLIHKDIACMIGLWEYNPPAILRAVQAATSKPAIVGFDENFQTLEGIQKGEVIGTVVQNPYMFGYESIKILAGLAKRDPDILKRKDIDAENRIYIPHRVIVRNPGGEKIGNSETIDVDVFYPQVKKLKGEG